MENIRPEKPRNFDMLLAFLLPAAVISAILFRYQILPFGEKTLLFSDLDSQYVEFMAEYRRVLLGNGSFSWSWHAGLGMNFLALIAYYLASPFNFLLVFFPEEQLPLAVSVLTVLKLGCAGASFALFLKLHYEFRNRLLPLFSACYALCTYALGYSFNLIWLDALIFLPLLCAGIDRMLSDKRGGMAGLTLIFALSFLSQFYMAWMTGVFCALYFLAQMLMRRTSFKAFLRDVLRFGSCVGIAAGLSALLLLPAFFVLKNNMGAFGQKFPGIAGNFAVSGMIRKLFICSFDGIKDCLPHICCGLPALIGVLLYFTRKQISLRERIISGSVCAFLVFSFWFAPLNFLWHAMDHPSWFPYRYAFVFCFWILCLAYEGIYRTEKGRDVLYGCLFWIVLLLPVWIFDKRESREFLTANMVFIAVYASLSFVKQQRIRTGLLYLTVSAELFLNGVMILSGFLGGYTSLGDYQAFHSHYRELTDRVQPSDTDFYRMEKSGFRTYNDPLGIGYPGVSHFSSTASVRQAEFLKRLGFNCYATWCTYQGSTVVSDALLGIRYEFGRYGKQDSLGVFPEIWQHPTQFPLFFRAGEAFARYDFMAETDAVTRQNDLLRLLSGEETSAYFEEIPAVVTVLKNLVQADDGSLQCIDSDRRAYAEIRIETGPGKSFYLFLPGASLNVTVTIGGEELMNGNRDYAPFPICLDAYASEGVVSVHVELLKKSLEGGIQAYALDTDRLASLAETVNASAPLTERTGETSFRLKVNDADEDRLVVSSIPFDAGWKVSADGKRIPLKMIHESVLGFVIPAGCDMIEVSYRAYGQEAGMILSGVSGILWLILLFFEQRKRAFGK